jgi:hypothetical protein
MMIWKAQLRAFSRMMTGLTFRPEAARLHLAIDTGVFHCLLRQAD